MHRSGRSVSVLIARRADRNETIRRVCALFAVTIIL
jgi:hypothetical protein